MYTFQKSENMCHVFTYNNNFSVQEFVHSRLSILCVDYRQINKINGVWRFNTNKTFVSNGDSSKTNISDVSAQIPWKRRGD